VLFKHPFWHCEEVCYSFDTNLSFQPNHNYSVAVINDITQETPNLH